MYAKRLKRKNLSFAHQISSSDLFLVSMASYLDCLQSVLLPMPKEEGDIFVSFAFFVFLPQPDLQMDIT